MKQLLEKLISGQDLTSAEASSMVMAMADGKIPAAQQGALLCALRIKGEAVSELVGIAELLRRHLNFVDCGTQNTVDIVGTGGDGGVSFNVSTCAAFVASGAGVVIAKHGNRAVSGKCGAADLLAALGFDLNCAPEKMERSITENGIGFLFAPKMHPILAKVAGVRRDLGVRTIFNLIGPLCNPAGATSIVAGVFDAKQTELYAETLKQLNTKRALVVHGNDGLDEISCCEATRVSELKDGRIKTYEVFPELLLGRSFPLSEISGGDAQCNAKIARDILSGTDQGAPRAIVVLNAAAAIYVAGKADSLQDAIKIAENSIDSGAAQRKLELLIEASRS